MEMWPKNKFRSVRASCKHSEEHEGESREYLIAWICLDARWVRDRNKAIFLVSIERWLVGLVSRTLTEKAILCVNHGSDLFCYRVTTQTQAVARLFVGKPPPHRGFSHRLASDQERCVQGSGADADAGVALHPFEAWWCHAGAWKRQANEACQEPEALTPVWAVG